MLELVDLGLRLPKKTYKERMPALQRRLHQLQQVCWEHDLATVVIIEGWDASGKGSLVRKLTERLEPRGFDLHTGHGPRSYELQLPWLWRYWQKLPAHGHMAIFVHGWYRRVLVERIDGEVKKKEWQRGYVDIRSLERALFDDRYQIAKCFLHIDAAEQERRLQRLEADETTAWRVRPKDWEHHRHYDDYRTAAEEMLEHTEGEWGPWTIVEATDGRWARVKVFETLIQRLEEGLTVRGYEMPEALEIEEPDTEYDTGSDD